MFLFLLNIPQVDLKVESMMYEADVPLEERKTQAEVRAKSITYSTDELSTISRLNNLFGNLNSNTNLRLSSARSKMRRARDQRVFDQRGVLWWLLQEDIQCRSSALTRLQSTQQRVFVDDSTSCYVNDSNAFLAFRKNFVIYQIYKTTKYN